MLCACVSEENVFYKLWFIVIFRITWSEEKTIYLVLDILSIAVVILQYSNKATFIF